MRARLLVCFLVLTMMFGGVAVQAATPAVHLMTAKLVVQDSEMSNAMAFFTGLCTHTFLDATVQEVSVNWRTAEGLKKAAPSILAEACLLWMVFSGKEALTAQQRWAMLGGVFPDLVDGLYSLINPDAWNKGQLIFGWHSAF